MRSARRLLQFDFNGDAFARRAPSTMPIPPEIIAHLERIMREHNGRSNPPNREDLRQIYDHFFNAVQTGRARIEFDSPRRISRLAWVLTFSEDESPRIVDTPYLHDALELIEDNFRMSALLGVFDALLQAWDARGARLLRVFVRRHLATYEGRRQFFQNIRSNIDCYCEENGATHLAMTLLRTQVKLSDVWSYLNFLDHMHMNRYRYFGAVAEAYVTLNSRLNRDAVADVVDFLEKHEDDKTMRVILPEIIEKLGINASEELRQPVQSFVLRKWGDPRTSGAIKWYGVSAEAKEIFTRWITKEDLRFFFDVVAQACNDNRFAYRKAFWLAYLEHISFCRPVLRRDVVYLLSNNPQNLQYYRERRPATLTGGNSSQHAFIIQMGDHTFVEFSTAGACYVYDNARRPFRLDASAYHMSELRNQLTASHRVIHYNSERYYWQANFAAWIRRELRISPLRSYRL